MIALFHLGLAECATEAEWSRALGQGQQQDSQGGLRRGGRRGLSLLTRVGCGVHPRWKTRTKVRSTVGFYAVLMKGDTQGLPRLILAEAATDPLMLQHPQNRC